MQVKWNLEFGDVRDLNNVSALTDILYEHGIHGTVT